MFEDPSILLKAINFLELKIYKIWQLETPNTPIHYLHFWKKNPPKKQH